MGGSESKMFGCRMRCYEQTAVILRQTRDGFFPGTTTDFSTDSDTHCHVHHQQIVVSSPFVFLKYVSYILHATLVLTLRNIIDKY